MWDSFQFHFWHLLHRFIERWLSYPLYIWERTRLLIWCKEFEPLLSDLDHEYLTKRPAVKRSYEERVHKGIIDDDQLTYGETQWRSFLNILKLVKITSFDVFVELGCGTGQFCFFVNRCFNIPAIGLDLIHEFIETAQRLAFHHDCLYLTFLEQDFFEFDFSQGTVFFATCTCFPDHTLVQLVEKFKEAPPGTRIVTITRPLHASYLKLQHKIPCWCSWGRDIAWIYEKISI